MLLTSMYHVMPLLALSLTLKKSFFNTDIAVKNKLKCGLLWSVLFSKMIEIITMVKISSELPESSTFLPLASPQHLTTVMTQYYCR